MSQTSPDVVVTLSGLHLNVKLKLMLCGMRIEGAHSDSSRRLMVENEKP